VVNVQYDIFQFMTYRKMPCRKFLKGKSWYKICIGRDPATDSDDLKRDLDTNLHEENIHRIGSCLNLKELSIFSSAPSKVAKVGRNFQICRRQVCQNFSLFS
jgi:hypothetical protein